MQIKQLTQASGALWQSAMAIYCQVFPDWEREPIAELQQAIDSASSRCIVLCDANQVYGVSITELYPQQGFALLGYLFIAPSHQGQGLGKLLCDELFQFIEQQTTRILLLVEAESGPAKFYQKLGFNAFDIDYLSPHYDDMGSAPMALMYHAPSHSSAPSPSQIWQMVEHIFINSYYLTPTDPRLKQQRSHILSKEDS
ncbi:GNAT family N-acetyltransferase [Shewanella pneumatophori]|uniref:GNAT family N-acetyltransferase n=1 Tax=Shewanella pneumatophori TaxID=314092 RepID=A0A9X1ZB98_9GAMM|nr:GNAT family N-acetyltransferase [Shewanella pneumatophori]MCL1137862.1 GNAT family N-acetyltransferase [Shewanella pneumatophori]